MARRFRFRLETVRKLRQRALEQRRRTVAEAVQAVARIDKRIGHLNHQLQETVSHARHVQQEGRIDVRSLSGYEFHRGWLLRKIVDFETELVEKRAVLETERCKLTDAWKHVRVIEQLRDKQWRRHLSELARDERALADEAALNVYLRDPDHKRGEVAA